jgi:hypothetical protein
LADFGEDGTQRGDVNVCSSANGVVNHRPRHAGGKQASGALADYVE